MARQQCSVSFGWQPTNDLSSLLLDLWGGGTMQNESWVWPEVRMPGRVAREQCL